MENIYLWIGIVIVVTIFVSSRASILSMTQSMIAEITEKVDSCAKQITYEQNNKYHLQQKLSAKIHLLKISNINGENDIEKYKQLLVYNEPKYLKSDINNILAAQVIESIYKNIQSSNIEPRLSDIESLITLL